METKLIDGRKISSDIISELKSKGNKLYNNFKVIPGLAVVYIGNDKASKVYADRIIKKCNEINFYSKKYLLSDNATEGEVLKLIQELNMDEKIHGIIVQFPVPENIDENKIKSALSPAKDVDCINPINVGKFYSKLDTFVPCTPKGAIRLIKATGQKLTGKNAVIVGRSNIVGKPVAELLLRENLTVTICHSKTKNLEQHVRKADIVVAAAGRPHLIKGTMLKEGSIVIDVGTNVIDGKLVGDVEFERALGIASYLTPVPGGVGPMTISMLLENTLEACLKQCELEL